MVQLNGLEFVGEEVYFNIQKTPAMKSTLWYFYQLLINLKCFSKSILFNRVC
jgi:hypothetical protein